MKLFYQLTGFDPSAEALITPDMDLAAFNPIFIHGGSGSGKTHLLMAAAHAFRERGLQALYCRAETFTEHVVSAIRAAEMHQFREAYRNVDVLLVDDVQLFSRKKATQEELFHTFNTLHIAGKQIILAADCPPGQLESIEPRLVSRFEWGVALPLAAAKKAELGKILAAKLIALDLELDNRSRDFLLQTFPSSTKSLTRAIEALVLRMHLDPKIMKPGSGRVLTLPVVRPLLEDLAREEQEEVVTPESIVNAVAEHYGIRPEDILGKSQAQECTMPRKVAMYLCRSTLEMPFTKIGRTFSRDHSTVMSSVKQVKKQLNEQNSDFFAAVNQVQRRLQKT